MKSSITVKQTDITELNTDAIVNAANSSLQEGGGVCGAIFQKAGSENLRDACSKIGECPTGSAVITPGFNLQSKYIIHAVGPIWNGGSSHEAELPKKNGCTSIAFPLISSGIYGYPKDEAWEIAVKACMDFIENNNDYTIEITFAVLSKNSRELGEQTIKR